MSTQKSKLEYLKKYESKPQKKKKRPQSQQQQFGNMKIIQQDDLFLEKTQFNRVNNDMEDEEEDLDADGPQIELTGNLSHLTKDQQKQILQNSIKNNKTTNIKSIQSNSSGKWVSVQQDNDKKKNNSDDSSSSSSSDSDSDEPVRRRRMDSSDEEEEEDRQQEKEDLLKKQLNKALAQAESSDSDVDVRRRRKDSSDSSDDERKLQQIRKQQKINQHKTVMRNEFGQVLSEQDIKNLNRDKKEELRELQEAQISRFSKGMKQMKQKQDEMDNREQQKGENFANYKGSKEHELEMIKKARFGDTMGKIIEQEDQQRIEKALGINAESKKLRLKCKFQGLPNRFNIEPGHRWNGVDLSNGYEVKFLNQQNNRRRKYDEQYENHMKDL